MKLIRYINNPILLPDKNHGWEAGAVFNPGVVFDENIFHMAYRAVPRGFSPLTNKENKNYPSSIGYAKSMDGIYFERYKKPLIKPKYKWDQFGCEDPRITKLNGKYYIFYTALSTFPYTPQGIKIGVAVTKDFKTFKRHLVTPFNSKAMALFPEEISGKITGILTVHTDIPPAKVTIVTFDDESQIWSKTFWARWYSSFDKHKLLLARSPKDQVEVGASPIKTKRGWLLIYSYIKNYHISSRAIFSIDAILLDLKNPLQIIGRTKTPLLVPEKEYEKKGLVPNVTFPEGAVIVENKLYVYYGAADLSCCLAMCDINELLKSLV